MRYRVLVDDNFHYMDESERYELGKFKTLEAAVAACKRIVDEFLISNYRPDMTAVKTPSLFILARRPSHSRRAIMRPKE